MKKIFSSLFLKYMVIFVSVLLITNVIASAVALTFFGVESLPAAFYQDIGGAPPKIFAIRLGIMSMLVGTVFIGAATKIVIKPIRELSEAAKKVAEGDFSVQIAGDRKGKDEVTVLTENFNHMVEELSKNEYLHKEFVSNVSHEFKTPITAISGYAELLSVPELDNQKRLEYAEIIINQSTRLAKLSSDLLRLSELEQPIVQLKKECFCLDEQIRDAILLLQRQWEEKRISLDIDLQDVKYRGDKALLYQVWMNIIGNAIRYTKEGGEIGVVLRQEEEGVRVEIIDNGMGMTKEQQERVFDRFYRAEQSRTTRGTGLGLSIAKKIIDLHEGEIKVESAIEKGTRFIVIL